MPNMLNYALQIHIDEHFYTLEMCCAKCIVRCKYSKQVLKSVGLRPSC